jgi:mRNA-degrading endonuclease RelE of RelBE toxin-antitoxin system
MGNYRLTKQAVKQLKKLKKSDANTAKRIKSALILLSEGDITGEALQGYSDFFKVRVGKFRLIHTTIDGVLIVAIIEKRETVYKTFKHLIENSDFLNI